MPSSEIFAAIDKELLNDRPRDEILISLMTDSYQHRKSLVDAKKSASELLTKYPALKRPAVVSIHVHALICTKFANFPFLFMCS